MTRCTIDPIMEELHVSHNGVTKRMLRKDPTTGMLYDGILGLGKNVSVLAMGGMILNIAPEAEAIFDAFSAAGGTVVDTAYVYGKGEIDRLLGKWITTLGRMGKGNLNCYRTIMVAPMWPGCISATDSESMAWLERTQTPIFAWSSQARGFFTDRARRDKREDPTLVNCWYSDVNFDRRDRVHELAHRLGVSPAQIALAYLFAQPFPIFPLIGPATLSEFRDSMSALNVGLSASEARWLRTGETE
jgi:aryl-alcohol dehydrogenase-like predicted oxidoreductase